MPTGKTAKGATKVFAYTHSKYGTPDVLSKVKMQRPTPKQGEVLVRVYATTVSSADWRLRSLTMPDGLGWIGRIAVGIAGPRKPVLGTDFSGVVVAVGAGVKRFKLGDAVIGFPGADLGAHAEYILMPADGKVTHKPANLCHEVAAAIPFGGTTAYDFLVNKGKLRAGEAILINGASGATGTACVQIAKHIGAHVTGVCSAQNTQMARAIGADRAIDYMTEDFSCETIKYDVIVDTAGTAPWSRTKHALRPGGQMLLISGNASDMFFGWIKARIVGKRLVGGIAKESRNILEAVVKLTADGVLQPVIDKCYPFEQMIAAHRHVDTGHKKGNVVVLVYQEPVTAVRSDVKGRRL